MHVILPNCRQHITAEDLDFISSVLCSDQNEKTFLSKLLTDDDARDLILDDKKLLEAILDRPDLVKISSYLYFYLLVRDGLCHKGLHDRHVADYVAEILAEYTDATQAVPPSPEGNPYSVYLVDMLAALQSCHNRQERLEIQTYIGNIALFMTGLFPQRIRYRQEYKGAPSLEYYERMGSANYALASHLHLAEEMEISPILESLANGFHHVRLALNDIRERLIFMDPPPTSLGLLPLNS